VGKDYPRGHGTSSKLVARCRDHVEAAANIAVQSASPQCSGCQKWARNHIEWNAIRTAKRNFETGN
jgi:hypothetical protein